MVLELFVNAFYTQKRWRKNVKNAFLI